jgi:hypothetical protein
MNEQMDPFNYKLLIVISLGVVKDVQYKAYVCDAPYLSTTLNYPSYTLGMRHFDFSATHKNAQHITMCRAEKEIGL